MPAAFLGRLSPILVLGVLAGYAALSLLWSPAAPSLPVAAEAAILAAAALLPALARRLADEHRARLGHALAPLMLVGLAAFAAEAAAGLPLVRQWADPATVDAAPRHVAVLLVLASWPAALAANHGGRRLAPFLLLPAACGALGALAGSVAVPLAALSATATFLLAQWSAPGARRLLAGALVLALAVGPAAGLVARIAPDTPADWPFAEARRSLEAWVRDGAQDGPADPVAALAGRGAGASWEGAARTVSGRFAELAPADQEAVARTLGYAGRLGQGGLSAFLAAHPEQGVRWQRMDQAGRWEIRAAPPMSGPAALWHEFGAIGGALALLAGLAVLARTRFLPFPAGPAALALFAAGLTIASSPGAALQPWWIASLLAATIAMQGAAATAPRPAGGGILVIRWGGLDDFVWAQTAFAAIHHHHIGETVTLLTTPGLAALGRRSGFFDAVWTVPPGQPEAKELLGLRERVLGQDFRRVYDLQCSRRTSLLFRLLAPGRRPEWSGVADGCSHPCDPSGWDQLHPADRYRLQLAGFGIPVPPLPDVSWLTADIRHFGLPTLYVLLAPGSSARQAARRWPVREYARLARMLAEAGLQPVIAGFPVDAPLAARIVKQCPQAVDLTTRADLAEVAELARNAVVAIGNDTDLTQLIAATGCPTVALLPDAGAAAGGPRGPDVSVLSAPTLEALPAEQVAAAVLEHVGRREPVAEQAGG